MTTFGTSVKADQLPQQKQTSLGLYVTAQEAYEMWKADPKRVKVLDVRMVEEYVFIGHAAMAKNIPLAFPKYKWDANKRKYSFEFNPDFIDHVKELFSPDDTVVAMCRSGGRSAFAINMLAKAGFKNAYNIVDGFEGDTVNDPDSVYHGKRMKNGWKNSAPWVYDVDPEKIIIEEGRSQAMR